MSGLCQDRAPVRSKALWTAVETAFTCPSCDGKLYCEPAKSGIALFCPWAKCECRKMNDGIEASSPGEAYAALAGVFCSWLRTKE